MSRKRLHKSSDAVISGVCGGIAEYFGIDPTLVRILAVVLCIAGLGLPVIIYVVCMIILPPDPGAAQGYVDARAERTQAPCQRVYASVVNSDVNNSSPESSSADSMAGNRGNQPPPPDPATRVSATGNVQSSGSDTQGAATPESRPNIAHIARDHWPATVWVGAVLIGIGVIALLCNFIHVSVWRFWPVVIIVGGAVSLFTPGPRGWSLERAGHSIVLITVGLALLAWMLQIVQTRVFVTAFLELWPALLVVGGLAVIGSAQKNSFIKLASSLVLSATILLGIWFYAGIDWGSLGTTVLLMESDGVSEFLSDLAQIR